jgi:hypothetical protein
MDVGRRKVLSGVVAASAIGLSGSAAGALTREPGATDDPSTSHGPAVAKPSGLVVIASNLRISSAGRAAPTPGESPLLSAELAIEGSDITGSLHGVCLVIGSPGGVGVAAPTSIETHHFVFPDGTLVGTGTASLDDSDDHFVVLGGTGAYAGASGSYAATERHLGLGGDGSAIYRFALLPQQGS